MPRRRRPLVHMEPGEIVKGNIDLKHRPVITNPDGTYSTVRSITVTDDKGRAILIPTVIPNHRGDYYVADDATAQEYFRVSHQHLGIFKTTKAADVYARKLHEEQAKEYPEKEA